jgi:hypothetical protein
LPKTIESRAAAGKRRGLRCAYVVADGSIRLGGLTTSATTHKDYRVLTPPARVCVEAQNPR